MQPLVRGLVGVTLGADGFLWLDAGGERHAPAPPVVIVDTLAASYLPRRTDARRGRRAVARRALEVLSELGAQTAP